MWGVNSDTVNVECLVVWYQMEQFYLMSCACYIKTDQKMVIISSSTSTKKCNSSWFEVFFSNVMTGKTGPCWAACAGPAWKRPSSSVFDSSSSDIYHSHLGSNQRIFFPPYFTASLLNSHIYLVFYRLRSIERAPDTWQIDLTDFLLWVMIKLANDL